MRWSESSNDDDGDADADIADVADDDDNRLADSDGIHKAEIPGGGIFSRHSSSYQRDSNSNDGKPPR